MYSATPKKYSAVAVCFVALLVFCAGLTSAQAPPSPPEKNKVKVSPKVKGVRPGFENKRQVWNESDTPAEKSIATDAKVNISLCVSAGNVKVTGWERDEVRVFISEGTQIGFKILQKNRQSEKPVWVMVLGFDPVTNKEVRPDECLSGDDIELDVPRGATVNIKSRESATTIDSVNKVRVENINGDIYLRSIAEGINATTFEGDVTVERSGGAISLTSTTGNILAFDAAPSEIGDVFRAKTSNGTISLQDIEHRQMEIKSNSGAIRFTGDFLSGGQYTFGTLNGAIALNVPLNTSCKINASFGLGVFASDIPLKDMVKSAASGAKNLSAIMGMGDATLNLTTYSGAISIKKR